ncbi:uncharacterized protein LOC111377953 [Olea europaea var. sylvestris]|uniref:uncharacterized protein LOC111377953 n=1 Tax=Olea europaea var. sylvestris TaxID=158386 RepID=UPI000C1D7E0E|nr:uncharacterized protein LOC111377953 [Olea europaea var. sylvestris]
MLSKETIDTDRIPTWVQINFNDLTLEADFYVIEMKDFYVILGMDWLDRKEEFRFYGSKVKALLCVISILKAKRMLRKPDCQGYLISLISTSSQEKILDDVPIIREYTDVFSNDLPATLVSKTPYRMAPKELQELTMQLEELLEKGFIRPSVSS